MTVAEKGLSAVKHSDPLRPFGTCGVNGCDGAIVVRAARGHQEAGCDKCQRCVSLEAALAARRDDAANVRVLLATARAALSGVLGYKQATFWNVHRALQLAAALLDNIHSMRDEADVDDAVAFPKSVLTVLIDEIQSQARVEDALETEELTSSVCPRCELEHE